MIGCKPLTDAEIALILPKLSVRDAMLFTLGLRTGFRISELLSVQITDLLEYGEVRHELVVARKSMKGKLSSRAVPLGEHTRTLLTRYLSTLPKGQKYLFESSRGKLSRYQAWRGIKNAAKECKLTGKIGTHSMRKYVAAKAYETSGKDLALTQRILGHKSVSSTISYLQVDQESLNAVWDKIGK